MSLEIITAVREEEARAESAVKTAQQEAKQLLKNASDEAYRTMEDAEERVEKEVAEKIAAGAESAKGECDRILADAKREAALLRNAAGEKMEQAVNLIISRLTD